MSNQKDNLFQDPNIILDSFVSLRRHHEAKKNIRNEQLTKIPIPKNGRILDIGHGPGLYLDFWLAHTLNEKANFTLFDQSIDANTQAMNVARAAGAAERVRTVQGDLLKLHQSLADVGEYDVIFIGNTIEFVADPVAYLSTQVIPYLKKGGILAIRDLDCAFVNCRFVKRSLTNRIVGSRIQNCESGEIFHNPFVGRDLQWLLVQAGLKEVLQYPYFVEFKAPLAPEVVTYLSELHTKWYTEDSFGILDKQEIEHWRRLFDHTSPESILHHPYFYYVETEYLAVGEKPM